MSPPPKCVDQGGKLPPFCWWSRELPKELAVQSEYFGFVDMRGKGHIVIEDSMQKGWVEKGDQ